MPNTKNSVVLRPELKAVLEGLGFKLTKDGKELFFGSGISLVSRVIGLASGYLLALLATNIFGAEGWGMLTLCLVSMSLPAILCRLGFDSALMRLNAQEIESGNTNTLRDLNLKIVGIVVLLSFTVTVVIFFLAPIISRRVFSDPQIVPYLQLTALLLVPISLTRIAERALRGFKLISKSTFLEYIPHNLYPALILAAILMIVEEPSTHHLFYAVILCWLFIAVQAMRWYKSELNRLPKNRASVDQLNEVTRIAFPLLITSSILFIQGSVDTLMIGVYLTSTDVGLYSIALKLANIILIPLTAVNAIAAPKFAELSADKSRLKDFTHSVTRLTFLTSLPILFLVVLLGHFLLGLFGQEFKEAYTALVLISVGFFINFFCGSTGYFMAMTGSHLAYRNISVVAMVCAIALNSLMIPAYGIEGAAVATIIVTSVWNFSMVFFIYFKHRIITVFIPSEFSKRQKS